MCKNRESLRTRYIYSVWLWTSNKFQLEYEYVYTRGKKWVFMTFIVQNFKRQTKHDINYDSESSSVYP